MAVREVSIVKAEDYFISDLEKEFERSLPEILTLADKNYEGAISMIDSYLGHTYDDMEFKKSLLSWKGLLYLENNRLQEAINQLKLSDQFESKETLRNFNVKFNLAQAYLQNANYEDAYHALINSLDQFIESPYLLKLLGLLAQVIPHTTHPISAHIDYKLQQVKQYYGVGLRQDTSDLLTEIKIVGETIHQARVRYNRLDLAVRNADCPSEVMRLLMEYLDNATSIEYFRLQAQEDYNQVHVGIPVYEDCIANLKVATGKEEKRKIINSATGQLSSVYLKRLLTKKLKSLENN